MPAYIENFNQLLSIGTVILHVVIILIAINLTFLRSHNNKVLVFFKKYAFYFGFATALASVGLSLFYSEIIGFPPCELCWIQRIFLYPQVILFGMELYKRDRAIVDYSMVMATFGMIVSLFHMYIERGGASSLSCAAGGGDAISCAFLYVEEFSYVTIPVMALTASLFIFILLLNYKYMTRNKI